MLAKGVSAGARVLAALMMMGTVIRMGRIQTVADAGNALLVSVVMQPPVVTFPAPLTAAPV